MSELWKFSALELARIFADGEASAVEIVDAHLARIDAVNPMINAVINRIDDQALAAATDADAARAAGKPLGPLAGVPFTIKENVDQAGLPTTWGIPALAERRVTSDAPVVERMKAAGAIPLARTNLPDMALRLHTDSALRGVTHNPWSLEHTAGGSSGGEGAALATGMSPIGLGNDIGGSLRNPATACSIASLKPTRGRIPFASEVTEIPESIVPQLLAVEGPMARRVADVRAGLHVLAGEHVRDPWSAPVPLKHVAGKRRVAVMAEPSAGTTHPEVARVTRNAAAALADAGVVVEEVEAPRFADVCECWGTLVIGGIGITFDAMASLMSEGAVAFMRHGIETQGPCTWERLGDAWDKRIKLIREWNQFFTEWDAVLMPTWTHPPFLGGSDTSRDGALHVLDLMRPVMPANVLNLPSAAVPAGLVDGLPVGVILTGPAWSELVQLELAELIEASGLAPATPIEPEAG